MLNGTVWPPASAQPDWGRGCVKYPYNGWEVGLGSGRREVRGGRGQQHKQGAMVHTAIEVCGLSFDAFHDKAILILFRFQNINKGLLFKHSLSSKGSFRVGLGVLRSPTSLTYIYLHVYMHMS